MSCQGVGENLLNKSTLLSALVGARSHHNDVMGGQALQHPIFGYPSRLGIPETISTGLGSVVPRYSVQSAR